MADKEPEEVEDEVEWEDIDEKEEDELEEESEDFEDW